MCFEATRRKCLLYYALTPVYLWQIKLKLKDSKLRTYHDQGCRSFNHRNQYFVSSTYVIKKSLGE